MRGTPMLFKYLTSKENPYKHTGTCIVQH
uniref:Uncharacterized protein n=1 Tax=Anguilla anguilla TaxID=7936 RepID=A0A0E9VHQ2_ANGAN